MLHTHGELLLAVAGVQTAQSGRCHVLAKLKHAMHMELQLLLPVHGPIPPAPLAVPHWLHPR